MSQRDTTGRETATGDLLRRRRARDLWISRGHLYGFVALVVVASATFFLGGFVVGRGSVASVERGSEERAADDELARVLSSIEVGRLRGAPRQVVRGARDYDAAPIEAPGEGAPADEPAAQLAGAGVATGELPPPVDLPPSSLYTVVVREVASAAEASELEAGLTRRGLSAWVQAALVDGATVYRVAVGGYPTIEDAQLVMPVVRAAGYEAHSIEPVE